MEAHVPQEWAESSKDGTQVNGDWYDLKEMKRSGLVALRLQILRILKICIPFKNSI